MNLGYDKKYKDVILSENDMLQCFKPVVQAIIELVGTQVAAVKKRGEPEVKTVVLVGGEADRAAGLGPDHDKGVRHRRRTELLLRQHQKPPRQRVQADGQDLTDFLS